MVVEEAVVSVGRAGDSSDASFTLSYSPARDEHGVIKGVLVTAFETSTLAAAQRQARAAVRAKADFLAVMSHELRTPLNAIGGYAELLQLGVRGPVTPEQRGDLERIQAGQQQLLGVIDDVLAYTKLEAGILHFAVEDVAWTSCSIECCALVGHELREKEARAAKERRQRGPRRARGSREGSASHPQPAHQRDQVHRSGRRDHVIAQEEHGDRIDDCRLGHRAWNRIE